ncbi:MAG: metallophosphoesterase family protein [Anaerolineaceae bacterium]|nr:metallophosphoesterase family protein [Anaerolineaceae bacterium]
MRIAAVYDIHGNLPALQAVLQDVKREAVECVVVGGDVVAGPLPNETLQLLQSVTIPTQFIRGNAESELLRVLAGEEPGGLSERADEEAFWLAKTLTPEHKQFVAGWPTAVTLEVAGWGKVLFCHATPHSDIQVFTRLTPEEKLVSWFKGLNTSLVVCGHTHMQFERTVGDVCVVNAGSVGMPFGRTGADWLLLDGEIALQHTDYDLEQAAAQIRQSNYPDAESFASGNVLQSPSEAQALEMLAHLEARQAGGA